MSRSPRTIRETARSYAALNHGHFGVKLHRSRDGGATWQPIATPAYPPKPEGYVPKTPVEGTPADWSLKLVWALAPGGADEPGVLWCGTLPGGLFRSDDHGESWTLNRPLWDDPRREEWFGGGADHPGIHSILVDPRDSAHVKVGVSCGGVWTTRDRGATWAPTATGMRAEFMPPERQFEPNVQDPHRVAQCRAGAGRALGPAPQRDLPLRGRRGRPGARSPASNRRRSGLPWPCTRTTRRPPGSCPRSRTRCDIPPAARSSSRAPATAAARSRSCANGLPQQHAYDLVYRHALDVDDTGQHLAFGSTTGSVWVSDDGGDSWQRISAHLPPVYAVTFEPYASCEREIRHRTQRIDRQIDHGSRDRDQHDHQLVRSIARSPAHQIKRFAISKLPPHPNLTKRVTRRS